MATCPACQGKVEYSALECAHCGIKLNLGATGAPARTGGGGTSILVTVFVVIGVLVLGVLLLGIA